jgi:hypothetical protein
LLLLAVPGTARAQNCPSNGAELSVQLANPAVAEPATVIVFGNLEKSSCEDAAGNFADSYFTLLSCADTASAGCSGRFSRLAPGRWVHRIAAVNGVGAGQLQGRSTLLLGARAGTNTIRWPLYRSVVTVRALDDGAGCSGCLREAVEATNQAEKPALIQFDFDVKGTIVLTTPFPAFSSGNVTLDAFDLDGLPFTRTLDGNGLRAAAVRITSADNAVLGLRVLGAGGDSDTVLVDGSEANRNLLDTLQIIGRSAEVCGSNVRGCVVNGVCRTPETDPPFGACGDDALAFRGAAGSGGENLVRNCDVSGGFDKGIKISNAAMARVEASHVHDNADGGIQATLGGQASAIENLVENNRGTNSANGLAANGPDMALPPAALLVTRGNITRANALRGISVRSQSLALLDSDWVCGNGTSGRGTGFGIAVQDAAGLSAFLSAKGLAVVHNVDGGLVVTDQSTADLGGVASPGWNAFAFNGPDDPLTPVNVRNSTGGVVMAVNNQWEHCGRGWVCDVAEVSARDTAASPGFVIVKPAQPPRQRQTIRIDAVRPTVAEQGDVVRIYGTGFEAIGGNGPDGDCTSIASFNGCRPVVGNCVVIGGEPAEVVAVTPTMIVARAPFTCVEPVSIMVRNRHARGVGRATFCTLPTGATGRGRQR